MVGSQASGAGLVLHGDGKKFDGVGFKGGGARGVWSPRPGETWVAPYNGAIEHWNGTDWTNGRHRGGRVAASHLRKRARTTCGRWVSDGTVLHNRGGDWIKMPSGATEVIWSVWSRTLEDAWAVGNGGTILRWNGSSWSKG